MCHFCLQDALLQNTKDFTQDGKKRMLTVSVFQILAILALLFISVFFWWYQLRPYMRFAKSESRRIAELLSQLPAEMAGVWQAGGALALGTELVMPLVAHYPTAFSVPFPAGRPAVEELVAEASSLDHDKEDKQAAKIRKQQEAVAWKEAQAARQAANGSVEAASLGCSASLPRWRPCQVG